MNRSTSTNVDEIKVPFAISRELIGIPDKFVPAPLNVVALTVPETSRLSDGIADPTPILPVLVNLNFSKELSSKILIALTSPPTKLTLRRFPDPS